MNALHSMTGFARTSGVQGDVSWVWEARSVNGKSLDVRWRLPQGLSALEPLGRKAFEAKISRGNIQASLTLSRVGSDSGYEVDEAWLEQLSQISSTVPGMTDPAHLPQLMQIEGVIRPADMAKAVMDEAVKAAVMESLEALIFNLVAARKTEGAALSNLLSAAVDQIEALTAKAKDNADNQPAAIKARFDEKFAALMGDNLDPQRLATEAAILAVKADVREELDRLTAHAAQARALLAHGSPIGRKLEFLAQEFNREINTLCSKSASIALTQIGLSLKSANEQFREQAANVE